MADDEKKVEKTDDDTEVEKTDDTQPDELAGLKSALAKEREARRRFEAEAKTNAAAAQRLKAAEDADKSEVEKAVARATAAEQKAAAAEARALRLEIAGEKGLTAAQAKRLVGETREELEADADELLETFSAKDGKAKTEPLERPGAKPRSGSVPGAEPEENDPTKLAALVPRT